MGKHYAYAQKFIVNSEFSFDLSSQMQDIMCSRPVKPLPFGTLKCGGFFYWSGDSVEYSKPAFTFEQQADLLQSRGLIADRQELIEKLKVVSYYRLSGYLHPFRNPGDKFKPGTTFD